MTVSDFKAITRRSAVFIFLSFFLFISPVHATQKYVIDQEESYLDCSVRYALIGTYYAAFKEFSGSIYFDPKNLKDSSVVMNIKVKSISSDYPVLDRIVRSKRLLDAAKYPDATFLSTSIEQREDDYWVTGTFNLHGKSKVISFPFTLEGPIYDHPRPEYVQAHGRWELNRKDFDVIWDPLLDKGGVMVSNTVVLDWQVVAKVEM